MPKRVIPSFDEAKKIVFGKVKNRVEYLEFRKSHQEYNLPAHPRSTYRSDYISLSDFFGIKRKLVLKPKNKETPTYNEAKRIIFGHAKNRQEYVAFRKNHPEYKLPSSPREVYFGEYTNMHEFLGVPKYDQKQFLEQYWSDVKSRVRTREYAYNIKEPIIKNVPTYEEARQILKGRQIFSYREYLKFREENPQYNLPRKPVVKYADKWISYPEFWRIDF